MKRKKRSRLSKDASRDKILKGSLELISQKGWSGLTFQKVAKTCRMSASNIVYHFSSREDLLLALLDHISANNWSIVQSGMKPELDAFERLVNHFEKNLEWAREFPSEAQVIAQIYAESGHDPEFARVFGVMFERAQERIREHLLAGQREGLFRLDLDSTFVARVLHNLLVGAFINSIGKRLTDPISYPSADFVAVLKRIVGYGAQPSP